MADKAPVRQLITALRSLAEPSANAPLGSSPKGDAQEASQPLPEGFRWDFRYAHTCARAIARQIGFSQEELSEILATIDDGDCPFCAGEDVDDIVPLYGVPARDVTPAMVADALEALIEQEG